MSREDDSLGHEPKVNHPPAFDGDATYRARPSSVALSPGQLPKLQIDTSPSVVHDLWECDDLVFKTKPLKTEDDEALFKIENNPFTFSPGQVSKPLNPKSLSAFYALGGLSGLEKGLRTDRRAGLSLDELAINEPVQFCDVVGAANSFSATVGRSSTYTYDCDCDGGAGRKTVFGENRLPPPKAKPLHKLMWEAWNDKVLILLTVAAVVSLSLGLYQSFLVPDKDGTPSVDWVEGAAIMVAVLPVVVFGSLNDWHRERQFHKLNAKKEDREVKVIRASRAQWVSVHDILVGDVLCLEPGDLVPVDGVLIDGHGIKCDESSITSESDLVRKTPGHDMKCDDEPYPPSIDPFILSGSRIIEGVGTALVTAVGANAMSSHTLLSLPEDAITEASWEAHPGITQMMAWGLEALMQQLWQLFLLVLFLMMDFLDNIGKEIEHCLTPFFRYAFGQICHDVDQLLYGGCLILGRAFNALPTTQFTRKSGQNPPRGYDDTVKGMFWDGVVLRTHVPPSTANLVCDDSFPSIPVLWLRSGSSRQRNLLSHRKLAMGFFLTSHVVPLAAAILTLSRGYRLASGGTASISGIAVIPLRTEEFPVWSWMLTYGVWAAAFSAYLWLQTQRIPPEFSHRRQLYLFCVIMAAVHFTIAISQGSASIPDAFTMYGPILLTASAYLMSLLLQAIQPTRHNAPPGNVFELPGDDVQPNPRPHDNIPMVLGTAMGMGF